MKKILTSRTGKFGGHLKWASATILALVVALNVHAGDNYDAKDPKDLKTSIVDQQVDETYFRANEWSADVFGSYSDIINRPGGRKFYRSGFGGGVGGNYFFTRNFGFGLEGEGWDGNHGGVGAVEGNFIARWPFEEMHLAPYAFIGGGYDFGDIGAFKGNAGLGVEYRFTPHIGIFADGRFVLVEKGSVNNYDMARLGVRYAF
jgi:hypothetical protein